LRRRGSQLELRRLYEQQRLTPAEIGDRLGVSGRTIRAWLQQAGIALRPGWERRRAHLPPANTELRRCYLDEGLTTAQLAARYGVSATTAKRWLDKAGIPRRSARRSSRAPGAEELRRLYQDEGLSTTQIAQRYGVAQTTAHGWLRAAGIPLRPAGPPVRADPATRPFPQTMVDSPSQGPDAPASA
jgi:DNA-binding transcriptional regulator LsrR (DeoR family)